MTISGSMGLVEMNSTQKDEEDGTCVCAVNVAREWVGYRREIVGRKPCGHPKNRHDDSICFACDEEGNTAGELHVFSSTPTDETGWMPVANSDGSGID